MIIDNDEGDHFPPTSMQSALFKALLAPPVCTAHVLGKGYRGHRWVQKVKISFSKVVPNLARVLKQVV